MAQRAAQSESGPTLGSTVRGARAAQGWTQEDLAREVGVAAGSVGRWERDEVTPHPHLLGLIADALSLDVGLLRAMMGPTNVTLIASRQRPAETLDPGPDVDRIERFADAALAAMERGDLGDPIWSRNAANLARLLGVDWDDPAALPD